MKQYIIVAIGITNLFFFLLCLSIYSTIFLILSSSFLFSLPFNSSDKETSNASDNGINNDISGVPLPVYHLEIAFSVTFSFSASSSWVNPFSFLLDLISSDIFSKSIVFTSF